MVRKKMQPRNARNATKRTKEIGLVLLTLSMCAWVTAAGPETIAVDGGQISGTSSDGVRAYKGIPFAAPPVGDLRWKAPQPVVAWSGVKNADNFGAQCMQQPYPAGSPYATAPAPTS